MVRDHFYIIGGPPPWKRSPKEEGWVNAKEVAAYLGISIPRVYANTKDRVIHSMGFQVYQMPSLKGTHRIFFRQIVKAKNSLR